MLYIPQFLVSLPTHIGLSRSCYNHCTRHIWIVRKGWTIKSTYAGIGCITILSAFYMLLYTDGQAVSSGRDAASMMVGSVNLSNFLGFTPQVDRELHAQSLGILAVPLFLALGAHRYTYKRQDNILCGLSLSLYFVCFWMLCFTCICNPHISHAFVMAVRATFVSLNWISHSTFMAILLYRCSRFSYSIQNSICARHNACIAEIFLSNQYQTRQQRYCIHSQTYIKQTELALNVPHNPSGNQHSDLPMWYSAYSCFFQTMHHQPIAENCVSTISSSHNRVPVAKEFIQKLLSGSSFEAWEGVKENQFTHIMLYPDLYTLGDYKRLSYALRNHTKEESTSLVHGAICDSITKEIYKTILPIHGEKVWYYRIYNVPNLCFHTFVLSDHQWTKTCDSKRTCHRSLSCSMYTKNQNKS